MAIGRLAIVGTDALVDEIAIGAARRGFSVVVLDLNEAATVVRRRIAARLIDDLPESEPLRNIEVTEDLSELGDCDFVLGCDHGDDGMARLTEIEKHMSNGAVLASVLNGVAVDALAGGLRRPTQFVGVRLDDTQKILSCEPTGSTAPGVLETARALCRSLGNGKSKGLSRVA